MLSVKEAAERACVSESLIYSWCADGSLPHYRLGKKGARGKIAIAAEDLDGLLASFKVGKKEPEPKAAPALPAPKLKLRHLRLPTS